MPAENENLDTNLQEKATTNVCDILTHAIKYNPDTEKSLVIFDTENGLTNILTSAYNSALPTAKFIDFAKTTREEIIAECNALSPNDLVVLIQSSNFRLDEFRIRLHLFQRKLKVIEHMHLYRNSVDQWNTYIDSLAYDPNWYLTVGHKLKDILAKTETLKICSKETELLISGGLEMPKLNIGDYTEMENIGGTFPIGEVFTEGKDFSKMNGSIMIYAYADQNFSVNMHEPFRVDIKEGLVVGYGENTPKSFIDIVELIKSFERPIIREIGFGLNRAITREHYLGDITAFERILGLHFSLGEKHSVYKKEGITTHKTKFHVDIFPVVSKVLCDDSVIFKDDKFIL